MYMRVNKLICSLLLILGMTFTICSAQEKADWQYVFSRNGVSYSVDMSSVRFPSGPIILFWLAGTDYNDNTIGMAPAAVNVSTREFRYEEFYIYDLTTKEKINATTKPSKWAPIGKGSPVELIVDYIFEHHPKTKDLKPEK